MAATKDEFFKPSKLTSQQKASATNEAVAQILAAETAQRQKKTDRLRQLRLEREAETVIAPPVAEKPKRRAAVKFS